MNVVIYARFSSHNQTEQSIEGQLNECYAFANRNGYTVIQEYIDRALSGTNDNRPAFQQMLEDSAKKRFEGVLVYQLDRFARNRYDSATNKARLKKNGVRVFSARENISDDASGILVEGLLESMAEYYSAELSQKIKRGMALNAAKGLYTGGRIPLGYKIERTEVSDRRIERKLVIDPETAPIVVEIFEKYGAGMQVIDICAQLNARKLETSTGSTFNKNSLRDILKNKKYIGVYSYNGEDTPGGTPQIVSNDLFYKVQDILASNKRAPARSKAVEQYLLTTKLFCGYCKEMLVGKSAVSHTGKIHRYYVCKNNIKKICTKKPVIKNYIEDLIVKETLKILTPENIDIIAQEVVAVCERENNSSNLKRLYKLLADNKKATENLIKALECGEIADLISARITSKRQELSDIEKEIALEELGAVKLTEKQVKFFLYKLSKGSADNEKTRKLLINIFVNRVYLYDKKLLVIFNTQDSPAQIDDELLAEIESNLKTTGKSSHIERLAPPHND